MRLAIVGSRGYLDLGAVINYVASLPADTVVISGGARGVDLVAVGAARRRGLEVLELLADWEKFGKVAGHLRNEKVVEECDKLVAFWDGKSPGTRDVISIATKAGKLEKVFKDPNPNQGSLF